MFPTDTQAAATAPRNLRLYSLEVPFKPLTSCFLVSGAAQKMPIYKYNEGDWLGQLG